VDATRRRVPRRDAGRFKEPAAVAADDAIHRSHNENGLRIVKGLSLFRIARRIVAPIFPADALSAPLVRWLFLSSLVANDTLLR
jgi:hypothetical protein